MIPVDDIMKAIPVKVAQAIQTHGFAKLAAQMYGVEEITFEKAAEIIGQRFSARRQEWREVIAGLKAFEDITG